jgi:hypothetical protein
LRNESNTKAAETLPDGSPFMSPERVGVSGC